MARIRFSKRSLARYVDRQIMYVDLEYADAAGVRRDEVDGPAQIPDGNVDAAVAYGRAAALEALAVEWDLPA